MKQRIKQLLRERLPLASAGELRELRDRVAELEQELDESRRDSLRVAEMLDLVEERLTPSAPSTSDTDRKK